MPKDRRRQLFVALDVLIVIERSSAHPVEYAIMLLVERDRAWHYLADVRQRPQP